MSKFATTMLIAALFSISLSVASVARQIERQTTMMLCLELAKLGGECEAMKR